MRRRGTRRRKYSLKVLAGQAAIRGRDGDLLYTPGTTPRLIVAAAGQHFVVLPPVESIEETVTLTGIRADAGGYALAAVAAGLRRDQRATPGHYQLTGAPATLRIGQRQARIMSALPGHAQLVGGPALLTLSGRQSGRRLAAYAGSHVFTLTPFAVIEEQPYIAGAYALAGRSASLNGH